LKKIARAGDHVSKFIAKSADNYLRDEARKYDKTFKQLAKGTRGIAGTARRIAKGMDGGARWLISGGNFSRNNGNDLDYVFGSIGFDTNGFFDSFVRSDLGKEVTEINQSGCLSLIATIMTAGVSDTIVTFIASLSPKFGAALGVAGAASLVNNVRNCISIVGSSDINVGGQ
jgi:hypothetical protein